MLKIIIYILYKPQKLSRGTIYHEILPLGEAVAPDLSG